MFLAPVSGMKASFSRSCPLTKSHSLWNPRVSSFGQVAAHAQTLSGSTRVSNFASKGHRLLKPIWWVKVLPFLSYFYWASRVWRTKNLSFGAVSADSFFWYWWPVRSWQQLVIHTNTVTHTLFLRLWTTPRECACINAYVSMQTGDAKEVYRGICWTTPYSTDAPANYTCLPRKQQDCKASSFWKPTKCPAALSFQKKKMSQRDLPSKTQSGSVDTPALWAGFLVDVAHGPSFSFYWNS